MKKLLFIFGTRPEAIKMAPIIKACEEYRLEYKVCITAQHREMLDQVLNFFDIEADFDLNLMKPGQDLYSLTSKVIEGLKPVLEEYQPDYVLVHGDTTTSMASAIASFYSGAKVCHVEAGLRTGNKWSPFPEEMNRLLTSRLTDIHFSPTPTSAQNLMIEGIDKNNIHIVGNTVIDALLLTTSKLQYYKNDEIRFLESIVDKQKKLILVTGHRRENFGDGFVSICQAIRQIANRTDVQVIYPVHLNPNVQDPVNEILNEVDNIKLISPLSYPSFVWLMKQSYIILTDSGGVQEEAPSLGKPVLVMREVTERPEAVEVGTVILVGTNQNRIITEVEALLDNVERYDKMTLLHNPYGDGQTSNRIINILRRND